MLQNYIVTKNSSKLLIFMKKNECDDDSKRQINNLLVNFMVEAFGIDGITPARKKMTALATVQLFPFFYYKHTKSDGIVSI